MTLVTRLALGLWILAIACGCSSSGAKQTGCTPGYPACVCTPDQLCLQGYSCQAGVCTALGLDGDAENETENEPEAEADDETDAEAQSCPCPDYAGRYCFDFYTYCLNGQEFATRSDDEPSNSTMIVVLPADADPASCRVRVVIESLFGLPASFEADRCQWPERFALGATPGPYLSFDPATRSFAIYALGLASTVSQAPKADAACTTYPGTVTPQAVFSLPACPAVHCFDTLQNFGESDTDCGEFCAYCANERTCRSHDDCQSMTCMEGECRKNICGDGLRRDDNDEACDDGNTESGDGCAADCTIESGQGWECEDQDGKSVCTCQAYNCPSETTDPCAIPVCAAHGCAFGPRPAGQEAASFAQTLEDCRVLVCTAEGTTEVRGDLLDHAASTECLFKYCDTDKNEPATINEAADKTCKTESAGAGHCDGKGLCVANTK